MSVITSQRVGHHVQNRKYLNESFINKLLKSNHTHRDEGPPLQKGFGQFVHGFAGEIVDNSGIEGVTAAVANISADNSRCNNASGGTGTGAGGAGEDGG